MRRPLGWTFLGLALALPGAAQVQQAGSGASTQAPVADPLASVLIATTDGGAAGALDLARGGPPWDVTTLARTGGGRLLRRFGPDAWLVDPAAGKVERIPLAGGPSEVLDLGASRPQDVHVAPSPSGPVAWISRQDDPRLARLDLTTGVLTDSVDLSPLGASLRLGTLERDGTRLFVQVEIVTPTAVGGQGALAVVDLVGESLVDVDPVQPGVQPIFLAGAPPHLKMQVVPETRTLFVSATQGTNDTQGAIEMVDLDALASIGFAVSEQQLGDLGGFVLTSPAGGYLVFHTDFAASTHLVPFTVAGGATFGELILLLGDVVDALTFDPRTGFLYLPSGVAAGPQGVWVLDTATNEVLGGGPIPTGLRARDVIVR